MNVKDFVRESLNQIITGVKEAQAEAVSCGAVNNPPAHGISVASASGPDCLFDGRDWGPIEPVDI